MTKRISTQTSPLHWQTLNEIHPKWTGLEKKKRKILGHLLITFLVNKCFACGLTMINAISLIFHPNLLVHHQQAGALAVT